MKISNHKFKIRELHAGETNNPKYITKLKMWKIRNFESNQREGNHITNRGTG